MKFNDLNQLWLMDIGLPGPDGPAGGRHVVAPPGWTGDVPDGIHLSEATMNRALVLVRAMPLHGDVDGAVALIKTVKVYPLDSDREWADPTWIELGGDHTGQYTPVPWETRLDYWTVLAEIIEAEPAHPAYRAEYGELAELGIEKGKRFDPDERMRGILDHAAKAGHAQLLAESFADRRPDRVVWPGTQWEWAVLQPENGRFEAENYTDLYAREKWFYQAQIESPAMFARAPGAGSLYWLGIRDANGDYLYGENTYTLDVPLPVPAQLFWSITVYDAETRSEIATDQNWSALRSLFELTDIPDTGHITLYVGPHKPQSEEAADRWIQTKPNVDWFVYFRIYGPTEDAFTGDWQLPDFQPA